MIRAQLRFPNHGCHIPHTTVNELSESRAGSYFECMLANPFSPWMSWVLGFLAQVFISLLLSNMLIAKSERPRIK